MARSYRGDIPIENPEAYARAVQGQIYARAHAKRFKAWEAANPVLAAWLAFPGYEEIPMIGEKLAAYIAEAARMGYDVVAEPKEIIYTKHPAGPVPSFARDAINKWGSLTDKGNATLQRIYDERMATNATREAQRAAERASATPWVAGRQTITGVILSTKSVENAFGGSFKMLVKREDGSKIFVAVPVSIEGQGGGQLRGLWVTFDAKVEPSKDDPTFAFGSRPTKARAVWADDITSQETK